MPNPIGANAGRSTAPESAIWSNSVSLDCLKLGRRKTSTLSARSPGPTRRRLMRKGDAKVFKKYSQMKVQMKREALKKINRKANEGHLGFDTERAN